MRSLLILVSLALSATTALAQEKIAFKVEHKEGGSIDVRECMKMKISGTVQGQVLSMKVGKTTEYREKALAIEDGLPVRGERTYRTHQETVEQAMGSMAPQVNEKKNPIVGKPVILARKDGEVQLEAKPEAGDLDEDDLGLGTEDLDALLPENPVAVGESWKVGRDKIMRLMGKDTPKVCEAACTLEDVAEKDGSRTARIAVKLTMKGAMGGGEVSTELTGPFLFDLSASCPRSIALKGTMKMVMAGATIEGPMEVESTVTRVK